MFRVYEQGCILREILEKARRVIEVEGERNTRYCVFSRGENHFAINEEYIREVVDIVSIHSIPHNKDNTFLGISQFHGQLCPCMDLFGVPEESSSVIGVKKALAIAHHNRTWFLIIDHVYTVSEKNVYSEKHELLDIHQLSKTIFSRSEEK